MIESTHPNIAVLGQLDLQNLEACKNIFADDFVWHYFNPKLPDLESDYSGVEGLKEFFGKLGATTNGSFQSNHIETRTVGDELVVTQACNRLTMEGGTVAKVGGTIEFDVVVIWRFVDGKIAEAWDIPSVFNVRTIQGTDVNLVEEKSRD